MDKEVSIEEKFERLKQIVNELKGDIKLQDSMKLYKEGKELVEECQKELADIEGGLITLQGDE